MIQAENLTKYYGLTIGVKNLNFQVEKGEVLGFLGPNGAGKTTTMKMLTCYLPPTEGSAKVCGYDILEHSMEVRKRIGYLPERNPLYSDMSVRGYLEFVAQIKGVGQNAVRGEVDRVIDLQPRVGPSPHDRQALEGIPATRRHRASAPQRSRASHP
jgi:ABC-2 type transport system ATP-binding protein